MTVTSETRSDEWQLGDGSKLALYEEVRDPMAASVREGIRRMIRRDPDEQDVQDVIFRAFNELWAKDLSEVDNATGFARHIAYKRGMDRGRRALRDRRNMKVAFAAAARSTPEETSHLSEADHEVLRLRVELCKERLTPEQGSVIRDTIEGRVPLKDWAAQRGTSYEACRRMRGRGLRTLKRCIEEELRSPYAY